MNPARVDEFRSFALERSLPMFRAQDGFLGVLFTEGSARFATMSFWGDGTAVNALESSPSYRATVDAIMTSGLLTGQQNVEIFDVNDGYIDSAIANVMRRA